MHQDFNSVVDNKALTAIRSAPFNIYPIILFYTYKISKKKTHQRLARQVRQYHFFQYIFLKCPGYCCYELFHLEVIFITNICNQLLQYLIYYQCSQILVYIYIISVYQILFMLVLIGYCLIIVIYYYLYQCLYIVIISIYIYSQY